MVLTSVLLLETIPPFLSKVLFEYRALLLNPYVTNEKQCLPIEIMHLVHSQNFMTNNIS